MLRFSEKKIITKEISINCINSRSFKSGEVNEENLLVRDELRGICTYGKGYCFTMSQLEMIVTALKKKLTPLELNTLKVIKDDFCFTITVNHHNIKQKKASVVSA